jgi:hypothetical protein
MFPTLILSSIAIYFDKTLKEFGTIYVDSIDTISPSEYPRFEIRFDGPNKEIYTKNCIKYDIMLNIMVITKQETNRLKHHELVSKAMEALDKAIPIYDSNGVVLDCLQSIDNTETTQYGSLDQNNNIIQTAVTRSFFVHAGA